MFVHDGYLASLNQGQVCVRLQNFVCNRIRFNSYDSVTHGPSIKAVGTYPRTQIQKGLAGTQVAGEDYPFSVVAAFRYPAPKVCGLCCHLKLFIGDRDFQAFTITSFPPPLRHTIS